VTSRHDVSLSPIDAGRAASSAAADFIPAPRDIPFHGVIALAIDATDTDRGIISCRATVPVADTGATTLLYPKWMPGYHSPQNPIELFAGLEIRAGDVLLDWRRDAVEVYVFHIDVPVSTDALDICFQFLSPTAASQGDVVVTEDLLNLQFGRMLLYPAGYYARAIRVQATVTLPDGWAFSTVLEPAGRDGSTVTFESTSLDVLVDSPLMAGRHCRSIALDETVHLCLFAHNAAGLRISEEQIRLHASLVAQADRLFTSRHFDRYRFLLALSQELGG
jgi:predicted metalloprotease with PDZ domain